MTPYLPPEHPLLSKRVEEIPLNEIQSAETKSIIERMFALAATERKDPMKRGMVGLAAPQIGINKCIILIDIGVTEARNSFGDLHAFINPKILWSSRDEIVEREGCYSVDSHVCGAVPRASSIRITAYDQNGNLITEEYTGYTARIFQHEIDHLEGIRFPDRVGEKGSLLWVEPEEFPEFRKNWRIWPRKCPWSLWLAMKEGKAYEAPLMEK